MEVLIIGGTRFLGKILSQKFILKKKISLTVLSRNPVVQDYGCNFIQMEKKEGLKKLKGTFFNLIFDFLAYEENDILEINKNLLFSKYILISTTWINKLNPKTSIDELITNLDQNSMNYLNSTTKNYLLGKRRAENKLFDLFDKENFNIVRLPIFFGNNDHTKRFSFYLSRLMNNDPLILVDSGENFCQIANVEDLAKGLFLFSEKINTKEVIINALPHKGIKVKEFIKLMMKSVNSKSRLIKIEKTMIQKVFPEYLDNDPLWAENSIDIGENNIFKIFDFKSTENEKWIKQLTSTIDNNYFPPKELKKKEIDFINKVNFS